MGKPNVLILKPDLTFKEIRVKSNEDRLNIKREWNPQFSPGKSVFSEERISRWKFWRRQRKLIILSDGALKAYEMERHSNPDGTMLKPHYWNREEERKIIAKIVAKSKAQQRSISNTQLIIILAAIGIIGFLLLVVVRNTGGLRL